MHSPTDALIHGIDGARKGDHASTIDPPMTRREIEGLEARCGALPPDIRELVEFTAGFSFDTFRVDFHGEHAFEFENMFACSLAIATDGEGNFWVVDITSNGAWRSVFFIAHDPPVAIIQARDVASFVRQVFDASGEPALAKDAAVRIWKSNPDVVTRAQALVSRDPAVRAFAAQVSDSFDIIDLRDSEPGRGFIWGSAGPTSKVHRAGEEPLFAIEQKKRSLLARLFSG